MIDLKIENNISEAKAKFLQALRDAAQETKVTLIADVQSVTPVGSKEKGSISPGALKRSISGHYRVENSGDITIEIGSPLVYAKKVEFENKSYIRSTFDRDLDKVSDIFNKHIKDAEL
ncbi:HK97 gp10 family phage protein [Clostridium baratii]|uniref:HK97 gp10 family phage protein n=1 Tax=Clostridium baratii TaxID=1561 RepID=UPI0030CF5689